MIYYTFIIATNKIGKLDRAINSIYAAYNNVNPFNASISIHIVFNTCDYDSIRSNIEYLGILSKYPSIHVLFSNYIGTWNARLECAQHLNLMDPDTYIIFMDEDDTITLEGLNAVTEDLLRYNKPKFYMLNVLEVPSGFTQYNYGYHRKNYKSLAYNANVISVKEWIHESLTLGGHNENELNDLYKHPYIYSMKPIDLIYKSSVLLDMHPTKELNNFYIAEDLLLLHKILINNKHDIYLVSTDLRGIPVYTHYSGGVSTDLKKSQDLLDQYTIFYIELSKIYTDEELIHVRHYLNYHLGYDAFNA